MNILILSCGTRNKLVSFFVENSDFDKVVVTDCSEQAPALYAADQYYIVPRMKEAGYLDCLLDICKKECIDVVLPLQEDELLLISENKNIFTGVGIMPVVSDYEKVMLCKDKYALNCWLAEHGFSAVKTMLASEFVEKNEDFQELFVKPRSGAGSIDTFAVRSRQMLEALVKESDEELIVQPRIKGKEFGVDVYIDIISKEVISCFCKQKLRMRAGETEKSLSVIDGALENMVVEVVTALGLCGPIDVDVLEQDGVYYILEINPRFGGGYPHAHICGVNFVEYLAKNGKGIANDIKRNEYKANVFAMKYSDIIIK